MGDAQLHAVLQGGGLFLTGEVTASAALVPHDVGRGEITKSSAVQEHPEHVPLKCPWLLPSQDNPVPFNLHKLQRELPNPEG